jgi:tape measure domain-containing protein
MSGVDNRVVKITFDNASFQRSIEETSRSLDKFNQKLELKGSTKGLENVSTAAQKTSSSLKLEGSTKGLENIGTAADKVNNKLQLRDGIKGLDDVTTAANRVDLGGMSFQVDGVSTKFLALATIAATVLAGITAKAFQAGTQIAKALTLDPVLSGFQEYELNMSSIQTILANTESKGETLSTVNDALDELNVYSDKTIYNFAQMAKNIGTFTAAGVDLDTSVSSIKGIANLAAISGSSSEQASTAMYQLSQALAAGKVSLMDWNSVVNAGMGGEIFKSALFETAKAMGTIANVPLDQSFTEWEDSGNSFRESLQDGWITADVLSTTLAGLSGDLSAAELSAKGFSDAQIVALQKTADTAVKAATEIKTATQLVSVVKEALGTGMASSFRLIVGDFMEAKTLFSGFGNAISSSIQGITERRNEMLRGWRTFGGRDAVLQGLLYALAGIKTILAPIREAFRQVFPPVTAATLVILSAKFRDFAAGLSIGGETAGRIKSIFTGLFSIFKIGIAVVSGIFSVIKNLFGVLFNLAGSAAPAAAGIGNLITKLQEMLVSGGGIERFFGIINTGIQKLGEFITAAKEKISSLFGGGEAVPGGEKATGVFSTISEKLSGLSTVGEKTKSVFSTIGDTLKNAFNGVKELIGGIGSSISNFFSGIGEGISSAFTSDVFKPALAGVAVGLFGGLVFYIRKFVTEGIKFAGLSDLLESFSGAIDEVGNTLQAFQLQIKADALLRIAIAMAVLTASIIALSFIEPTKIATSLGAVAGGIGSMVAALTLLSKIEMNPVKLMALASSMTLLGIAMLALTVSIVILSRLDPAELVTGLAGIAAGLGGLVLAAKYLDGNTDGIVKLAFSLGVLAVSMLLLSFPIKAFGSMDLKQLGQGLLAVGVILAGFVLAMKALDNKNITKLGVNFVLLGIGLLGVQKAVQKFADMPWSDMVKGLVGLGAALFLIIQATLLLPDNLVPTAFGLLVIAGAMYVMAQAVKSLGSLELGELIKGIAGMAAVLAILVIAANSMQNALPGAASILIMSAALYVLAQVLSTVGQLSLGEIGKGLLGIAGVLLVLGLAAAAIAAFPPLLAALIGLGAALILVGAAFALFGVGAKLFAESLEIFARVGPDALNTFGDVLDTVAQAVPRFIRKLAEGFIELIKVLLDNAPDLVNGFGDVLLLILDKIIELSPKIGEAIGAIMDIGFKLLREKVPIMIQIGIELLTSFLNGINDNIEMITTLALSILTNFINGLTNGIPLLLEAGTNFIVTFINGIALNIQPIIDAGFNLIVQLINGIRNGFINIASAVTDMITEFITQAGNNAERIAGAGTDALVSFLGSISGNLDKVITAVADLIENLIYEIGQKAGDLATAGKDAAVDFLDGLVDDAIDFADKAGAMLLKLLSGLRTAVEKYSPEIRTEGRRLAGAIIDGMTGGLASRAKEVFDQARSLAQGAIGIVTGVFDSNSPSKVFIKIGKDVGDGLVIGLSKTTMVENASEKLAESSVNAFSNVLSSFVYGLESIDEFNPRVTPVLDLSNVQKDASYLSSMLGSNTMTASLSYGNARYIAKTTDVAPSSATEVAANSGPTEITFEQNIYSPTALSTSDIYRNTRSQITLAKEELSIP